MLELLARRGDVRVPALGLATPRELDVALVERRLDLEEEDRLLDVQDLRHDPFTVAVEHDERLLGDQATSASRGADAASASAANSASCSACSTIPSARHCTPSRKGRDGFLERLEMASCPAAGCWRAHRQAGAERVCGLVVEGVDLERPRARDAREQRAGDDADRVPGLGGGRRLAMVVDVLVQRAAARDVQGLEAAADAEQRQPARVGPAHERDLGRVDDAVGRPQVLVAVGRAVLERVEVGPAGEAQAVEPVEQRVDGARGLRREHDGDPAAQLDRP